METINNQTKKYILITSSFSLRAIKKRMNKGRSYVFNVEEINENTFSIITKILIKKKFEKISLYFNYEKFAQTNTDLLKSCIKRLYEIQGIGVFFIFDRNLTGNFVPFYELKCI